MKVVCRFYVGIINDPHHNRIQDDFYNDKNRVVEIDNQIELLNKNKTTVLAAAEKIIKYGI